MKSDYSTTDHLDGTPCLVIEVHKQLDGIYKATCQGLEALGKSESHATLAMETKLHEALLTGDIYPGS